MKEGWFNGGSSKVRSVVSVKSNPEASGPGYARRAFMNMLRQVHEPTVSRSVTTGATRAALRRKAKGSVQSACNESREGQRAQQQRERRVERQTRSQWDRVGAGVVSRWNRVFSEAWRGVLRPGTLSACAKEDAPKGARPLATKPEEDLYGFWTLGTATARTPTRPHGE
ncbi:hypothetical protein CC79DRAFT_1324695 [Sarocladium strictum]